jgi:serine protease
MKHCAISGSIRFPRIVFAVALLSALLAAGLFPTVCPAAGLNQARPDQARPDQARQDQARLGLTRTDRVVVKFVEGTGIRLRAGRLQSPDSNVDLAPLQAWLARNPGVTTTRHFARGEDSLDQTRESAQRQSAVPLADLNLYYQFHLPPGPDPVGQAIAAVEALRNLSNVQTAFLEPIPRPAVIGEQILRSPALPSPDFTSQQGYLFASPSGINAQAVWGYPGGRGASVKLIDVEGAWLWSHEDLPAPFFQGGTQIDDPSWRNHGTAVMGEMVGQNNFSGVTGIVSDMQVGCASIGDMSVAAALDLAAANLAPGDLFLIELHSPGPNSNGSGQYGYIPMESWQDNFDAIQTAVANGRICIEAAGNGEQNLDDPVYQGLFNRQVRDSGAILVGAGTPTGLDAEWFTNYGSRVDLNGWGESVVTCGYGDLQGGPETQWYTGYFSGTSSASPIICGSVASLQGMCKAQWGMPLNGPLAARILSQTGTPWVGPKRIGPRPNLVAARQLLLQGVGAITGTVRDATTGTPIAGAEITLLENGFVARTDAAGIYTIAVLSGTYTVRVESFFYLTDQHPAVVTAGATVQHGATLQPIPTGALTGSVLAWDGTPLLGATVSILDTPIPAARTWIAGRYFFNRIPAGSYGAIFGAAPERGPAYRTFVVAAGRTTLVNPILVNAETFETGNGGFTEQAPWAWGSPSVVGPPGAFSGARLWATNLSGEYGNNVTAYLSAPSRDFTGASRLYFSFTHWYDAEADYDGGNVQVRSGSNWITLTPLGGYPVNFLAGLGWESGYSGQSEGWQPAVFDLTPYIGSAVQIRFHFGSDGGVTAPGWYIDDVAFDTGDAPAAVEDPSTASARTSLAPARPNPFCSGTTIAYRLSSPAPVTLSVYDPSGRLVRVLYAGTASAGEHSVTWDGSDRSGRPVASGAFFCALRVDDRLIDTKRLLRIR